MPDWAIVDVSPTLRPHRDRIEATIEAVRARIAPLGPLQRIEFVLKANRSRVIGRLGHGGFCGEAHRVRLSFDPKNPNFADHLGATLERTIAHEYHHALRWAGPGYGARLGAQLVSEGLAGRFVRQLYASPPEPWEAALSPDALAPWWARALEQFEARDHGHANWFFGADGRPPWLGYTLGYELIGRHLAGRPDVTPLSLAHEPYATFRPTLAALAGARP